MKPSPYLILLFTTVLASASFAQSVSFTPTADTTPGDGSIWDLTVTSGAVPSGSYSGWCISSSAGGYDAYADFGHNFVTTSISVNDVSYYSGNAGTPMAGAMINYLVDNYYGFWNEAGISSPLAKERLSSFHNLLWEVSDDYNPTTGISSLDLSSGNFYTGGYISPTDVTLFSDLNNAFATLSSSYTSRKYNLYVLAGTGLIKDDALLGYDKQPLLIITPIAVPEPSAFMLVLASGGLLLIRKRAQKSV